MPTITDIDVREMIAEAIVSAAKTFSEDLAHLSEEQLHGVPMGAARTPVEFIAECIGFNRMVARIIRGEKVHFPTDEEREAFVRSLQSVQKMQSSLVESADQVASTLRHLSGEELSREVSTPWGQPMPAYKMANLAASHMSYHDGQINYVQSLYGDDQLHWA